jgi:hypothetical protein
MKLTEEQAVALHHLRSAYVGPEGGDNEVVYNRPHLQYAVGMLFPMESQSTKAAIPGDDPDTPNNAVDQGEVEESGASVPLAEDWRPSSAAVSFVTCSRSVIVNFSGGTYAAVKDDGPPRWQRRPFLFGDVMLTKDAPLHELEAGGVPFRLGSRWRAYGDAQLVTVYVRITEHASGDDKLDISRMLFQVSLQVKPGDGEKFLEYDSSRAFDFDRESAELRLRYRNRKVFAVGHGMAADWELGEQGQCENVFLSPVPAFVVPAVEVTGFREGTIEYRALSLQALSRIDSDAEVVLETLDAFVSSFSKWVSEQEQRVSSFGNQVEIAGGITMRSRNAVKRMTASVESLRAPGNGNLRKAFALAMAAMRLQMRQAAVNRGETPGEPSWRPFQLGFLLVSLASTVDETHPERDLVDLIWFPTGGGKTEAYLGLAAIEIFRRRIELRAAGGGTAVITRYTLRLLTAQQFQRTAALICAMEILRLTDERAKGHARFSIGLWIGNEATPGTLAEAKNALERLHKAARPEEANGFQVESCPWCSSPLVPEKRTDDKTKYGFRFAGNDFVIHCTTAGCQFSQELPLNVIDNVLYADPPTILLATVDKFARLQFKPEAGRLLGLDTPYKQPSMIIQDELHLLSGPLGTTVAVFDAVIQLLLSKYGAGPKIIASTATIRASDEQIRGLYGRTVALYPPAGLDDDRTFFSRPVESGEGRLYIGFMPQSVSQASALVAAAAPLLELPTVMEEAGTSNGSGDSYWTTVMYHNSLRELGRSGTLVVDDVNGRLETRSERLGMPLRGVRSDRIIELTSRKGPEELPKDLRLMNVSIDNSDAAVDVVLSSNMLSVGIDIQRLALMLMVGQPKTTAEYIQATSRVGRGRVRGIVMTLFRSNRARDRSHFETFRSYHEALYRSVEPTSVTPWSLSSRDRSLGGALVALLRQSFQSLASNDAAGQMNLEEERLNLAVNAAVTQLLGYVARSEKAEQAETEEQLLFLLREWDHRAKLARQEGVSFPYEGNKVTESALLKRFGAPGEGWLVTDSMRSVEENVAVEVREPSQEVSRGSD